MEQEILTDIQEKIIKAVAEEPKMADFYLSGGTALAACYFQHRISDDLDFFVFNEPDKIFLHGFAEKLKTIVSADSMRFERLYDRNQFFFIVRNEESKVEFTKYPFEQLEKQIVCKNIKVDSLRDIAANKLMALLDRFDPKDFIDLYFVLQNFNLQETRKDVERKFGIKVDNIFLGGELAKVKNIEALPKMLKPLSIKELKKIFSKLAEELAPQIFE